MKRWIGLCLFLGLSWSLSAQDLESGRVESADRLFRTRHPEGVTLVVEGRDFISKPAFERGMVECFFRDEADKEYELRLDTAARFLTYDAVQFPAYMTPPMRAYWQKALRLAFSPETRKALGEQQTDKDPTIFLSFIYDEKGEVAFFETPAGCGFVEPDSARGVGYAEPEVAGASFVRYRLLYVCRTSETVFRKTEFIRV